MSVEQLEGIALASQLGQTAVMNYGRSKSLTGYGNSMGIDIRERITSLRNGSRDIICADIGGSLGNAAKDMNAMPGTEAFVIDKAFETNPRISPNRRRIVANAYDMPLVPDESFHFIVSYNSLLSPECFREIYRVLKPAGIAILDLQTKISEKIRGKVLESKMDSSLYVHTGYSRRRLSLADYLLMLEQADEIMAGAKNSEQRRKITSKFTITEIDLILQDTLQYIAFEILKE